MRFLLLFTLSLASLAGIYFGFISFVDPYGEHGNGTFPVLVLDSRRAKLQLLHHFAEEGKVDGLILGSSRSLLMRPEALAAGSNARIFNFAVDNAHAEDFLAIYHYALAQGISPKFLVIGLDIASLQTDDVHDHMFDRSELKDYLAEGASASSRTPLQGFLDAKSVYTKDYLKDGFKAILMKLQAQTPKTKFEPDGYEIQFSGADLPPGEMGRDHDFADDVKSYLDRLSGMHTLSPKRLGYLAQLFSEARLHNTTTVVWLTPIHPRLSELISGQTGYQDLIRQADIKGSEWESAYGVHYHDFTDVHAFGGMETAWNDSTHMNVQNMDRVARALAGEVKHGL